MTDPTATTDPAPRRPKIEIYPYDVAEGADPEHGFRLKAENGEIVMHGEGYRHPDDAEAMARKIIVDHAYDNAVVVFLHPAGESLAEEPAPDRAGRRPATVIPEALASEDGERWWAKGHVAPTTMLLATLVETATNYGHEDAGGMLASPTPGASLADNQAYVAVLADQVRHFWWKRDPDNDERMLDCEPDDEGAEPWTELAL